MNRFVAVGWAVGLGLLGASFSVPVQAKEGLLTIRVCNRSADDALVALSYVPPGENRFLNEGWFRVEPGECKNLAKTDNANFYAYADVDGTDRYWGGSHDLCVEYPGPYEFYSTGSDYCEADQDVKGFVPMTAKEPGTYTWNLDP